jgi:aminodeoxyfutalosine deaminase
MIRKFSASWVYTLHTPPLKNGIVSVDENGQIVDIADTGGELREMERLEHHSGIITPGFVNAHCHLEFSHLKGKINEHTGMPGFLSGISRLRNFAPEEMERCAKQADRDMFRMGISAVGDVSNAALTTEIKRNSQVSYFTFVETFGFHPSRAPRAMDIALRVWSRFNCEGLPASIVPHSPYSVSDILFQEIGRLDHHMSGIISMHNQESPAENEFFRSGGGPLLIHIRDNLGIDTSHWQPTGKSALESVLPKISAKKKLLLVHNVFSTRSDIALLREHRSLEDTFLVLCPNSNMFIGNGLPPVELFKSEGMNICIGTDSLASNHQLSVLAELITLQQYIPALKLQEILTWACLNGARALQMEDRLGTLEVGKRPGLVLIEGVELVNQRLTTNSRVKRLV